MPFIFFNTPSVVGEIGDNLSIEGVAYRRRYRFLKKGYCDLGLTSVTVNATIKPSNPREGDLFYGKQRKETVN